MRTLWAQGRYPTWGGTPKGGIEADSHKIGDYYIFKDLNSKVKPVYYIIHLLYNFVNKRLTDNFILIK